MRRVLLVLVAGVLLQTIRSPVVVAQDDIAPVITAAPTGTIFTQFPTVTIEWCDNQSLNLSTRKIWFNGPPPPAGAFTHSNQTGIPGCPVRHRSTSSTLSFNLGNNTLRAQIADNAGNMTTQQWTIHRAQGQPPIVSLAPYRADLQDYGRCAMACFAATYAQSTVPYFSLDAPRSVTLVYNSDRANPRPFVHVDVTHGDVPGNLPVAFALKVRYNGTNVTFLNGDTALRFVPQAGVVLRLGGQFDAVANGMGADSVYPVTIVVKAEYSASYAETAVASRVIVINENDSPIARGWTIAGVQRLYPQADGSALISEGEGSATFFLLSGGSFQRPAGDFTTLTVTGSGTGTVFTRTYPDSTRVRFNHLGYMTSLKDRWGDSTRIVYDGSNRVSQIIDPAGIAQTLGYGSYGLSWITALGRTTTDSVRPDRTLYNIVDPDGSFTDFAPDASGRLNRIWDRNGALTTLAYDTQSGKLASVTAPAVPIFGAGSVSPVTTFSAWQAVGVPYVLTSTTPFPATRPDSVRATVTDPGGHVARFTVNPLGQALQATGPLGDTVTVTYNSAGQETAVSDRLGIQTASFQYNANGFLTQASVGGITTNFKQGGWFLPDSIWGPSGPRRRLRILAGNVDSVITVGGYLTRYSYDAHGRALTVTDPAGHLVQRTWYDGTNGNRSRDSLPGGRGAVYGYDSFGRLTTVSATALPARTTTYNALNRPVTQHDGVNTSPTTFRWGPIFLDSVTDPAGQVHRYAHNALGWVTAYTDPANRSIGYQHDLDGLLRRSTNRRGQTVDLSYDALHRRLTRTGDSIAADTMAYGFASNGVRIASSSNTAVTDSVFFNGRLQPDSVRTYLTIPGSGRQLYRRVYAYRSTDGRLDTVGWSGPVLGGYYSRRYRYNDSTFVLDTITLSRTGIGDFHTRILYNGDPVPVIARYPVPSGSDSMMVGIVTAHDVASVRSPAVNENLHFNLVGQYDRIVSLTSPLQRRLEYDGLGRLSLIEYQSGAPVCTWELDFGYNCTSAPVDSFVTNSYDPVGNRLSRSSSASGTVTGSYDPGNRIRSFAGCSYDPDLDGNVVARRCGSDTTSFRWHAEGRLASLTTGGNTTSFSYDPQGRLVRRDLNGSPSSFFVWNGDHLLGELAADGVVLRAEYDYYGVDGLHAMMIPSVSNTYAHTDALGNVRGLTRWGAVQRSYSYDEWGQLIGGSDPLGMNGLDRARWKGALYMAPDANVYFMRNRWYEPRTGRFLSEDPIGLAGGNNPYVFAANDPLNNRDPFGLRPCGAFELGHEDESIAPYEGDDNIMGVDGITVTFHGCPRSGRMTNHGLPSGPSMDGGGGPAAAESFSSCVASVASSNFRQTNRGLFGFDPVGAVRAVGGLLISGPVAASTNSAGPIATYLTWRASSIGGRRVLIAMAFGQYFNGARAVAVAAGVGIGASLAVNGSLQLGVGLGSVATGVGTCWK